MIEIEITTTKLIIAVFSLGVLILIKPIVKWFMRDKYKVYNDVLGNKVRVKMNGYIKTGN